MIHPYGEWKRRRRVHQLRRGLARADQSRRIVVLTEEITPVLSRFAGKGKLGSRKVTIFDPKGYATGIAEAEDDER